jgi:hypothetical protein
MPHVRAEFRGITLKLILRAIIRGQHVAPIRALQTALHGRSAGSGSSSLTGSRLRILALRLNPRGRHQEAQGEQECLCHKHSSFLYLNSITGQRVRFAGFTGNISAFTEARDR